MIFKKRCDELNPDAPLVAGMLPDSPGPCSCHLQAVQRSLSETRSPSGRGPSGCSVRQGNCTPSGLTGSLSSCGPTGEAPAGLAGDPGPSGQMALS